MQSVFSWLSDLFVVPSVTQTLIVLTLVSAVGLKLGKLQKGRFSLGITFVFFFGIVYSYVGYRYFPLFGLNADMIGFAQSFGLVLFIYALGLEVGPAFFPSLKKGGIAYNIMGVAMTVVTLLLCVLIYYIPGLNLSMPTLVGIMSGAVTNTPVLGAAQTTLQQISPTAVGLGDELAMMAQGCTVAYPMGVVGVIITLALMGTMGGKRKKKEKESQRKAYLSEFEVCNPALEGKTVREVVALTHIHFVISRIWQKGVVVAATSDTSIRSADRLLTISSQEDVPALEALFGRRLNDQDWNRPDIDWDAVDKNLVSRRIVITQGEINGVRLGSLRLRNLYGINITRIDRAGIELLPDTDLHLQLGDRLTVVGESTAVNKVLEILGDQVKDLDKPNLLSFFGGILVGILVGMIPFFIPGMSMPIKLGLAGGPIIVGILMGAFGPRLHLSTYITNSATQMMKQMGIILYLAGLGLMSGNGFFDILLTTTGLTWLIVGAAMTILPPLLIGLLAMKIFKVDLGAASGVVCGSMANSMALDFADSQVDDDSPSVVYATVYPLSMFVRIITAQILVMLFAA